jgi:dipeptidyl aminopeptidase/acylaminoacyl peptidase
VTDRSGPLEIWLRTADGQWDTPLVTGEDFTSPTVAFGALAFSQDGDSLAYQRLDNGGGYRLWISPRARGAPTRLCPNEMFQDAPTWSPDGKSVGFVQGSGGRWNLVRAQPGESAAVIASDAVVPFTRPQWSPDGDLIAFQSPEGLSVVGPDGQGRRHISYDDWLTFAWSPTDKRIYGLRRDDDGVDFSLAVLNPKTAEVRAIGRDLGRVPIANQPIRGFTWTGRDFATSIARVRSDIWILDGFGRPPSVFDRFWFFSGFFTASPSAR